MRLMNTESVGISGRLAQKTGMLSQEGYSHSLTLQRTTLHYRRFLYTGYSFVFLPIGKKVAI